MDDGYKILDSKQKIYEKHHVTATPIINPFQCPFIYLPIVTNVAKSSLKMIVYLLECIRLSVPLLTLWHTFLLLFFLWSLWATRQVIRCHWIFRCFDRNFLLCAHPASNGRAELRTSNHFPQRFYQIVRNITFYVLLSLKFFSSFCSCSFCSPHTQPPTHRLLWLSVAMYHCIMQYIQFCCWSTSFSIHLIISSSAWWYSMVFQCGG